MFGNFRERFQTVRHDVTQGWKSIADKAKSVNKTIVRNTTLITDELVVLEGEDQCFSCELEAGSEILSKYQKDWVDLHEASSSCAQEAENVDQKINNALKRTTELRNVITILHGELERLPDIIKQVQDASASVDAISSQTEVLEGLLLDLEEVCENLDLERRKTGQRLNMIVMQQTKLDNLEKLKEDLEIEHELKNQKKEFLERQESVEKQKVYEDAFIEQMNYYIQFGHTEEPISTLSEAGSSLADIKLDVGTLDKELDDFLGPEDNTTDPSIPAKVADRTKHKRKKNSSLKEAKNQQKNTSSKKPIQKSSAPVPTSKATDGSSTTDDKLSMTTEETMTVDEKLINETDQSSTIADSKETQPSQD
ncbi:dysbindin [Nematostella vectensis]|uniref:dysbindin n=1 Tax=Nematostella vectensis TaxID=45351 RepID=UPI002077280E|nr:dysbindin [Nematostella vectensis]